MSPERLASLRMKKFPLKGSDVIEEQKSGSGRVRGSTFRGRPPRVFGVSGIFKVKFRIG